MAVITAGSLGATTIQVTIAAKNQAKLPSSRQPLLSLHLFKSVLPTRFAVVEMGMRMETEVVVGAALLTTHVMREREIVMGQGMEETMMVTQGAR